MPVDTKHEDYEKHLPKWFKYRTVIEGEDAIKEAGTDFLPMLEGQNTSNFSGSSESSSYNGYKDRACFFAATARIADGITGAVFRKDPVISFPESRKEFLDTIGKEGTPISTFIKNVFTNVMEVGRHGVLLDMPENAGAIDPPYLSNYNTESIINWRTAKVNGKDQLVLVVLQEFKDSFDEDPFCPSQKEYLRVLMLGTLSENEKNVNPYYFVQIYEKLETPSKKDKYVITQTIIPDIRGQKIDYIPFVFFGPKNLSSEVQKSPIADIVAINISHYRSSADLEHGRHFTALPTAWVAGFDIDTELKIGSTTAWVSKDPNAKAGFLEFTGQGLTAIETALNDKEEQMAVLGARLLEEPKKSVESAETHIVRKGGEESVTASLARTVSLGVTQVLKWAGEWMGIDNKDISCELNRDYSSVEITPQMLQVLMAALQSGRISMDTWIYNLQRGEILKEGRTLEQELDLIEEHPPIPSKEEIDLGDEKNEEIVDNKDDE